MENEQPAQTTRAYIERHAVPISIIIAGIAVGIGLYAPGARGTSAVAATAGVAPESGVELPARWGDLGKKLVEAGAIDTGKMTALYQERGGFPSEYRKLLEQSGNGKLVITADNAGYLLNLLWALGLANKNPILEDRTEMMNPGYGGAGNFASTGGWTIAKGDPMAHYNMHALVTLTPAQQVLVDKVSRGIFRPCCGNSTHFPDCNHGMAMLGLLELMAREGASEAEMYQAALAVNSYWFPDTYRTIAEYLAQNGIEWNSLAPREILSAKYSSASGYAAIAASVKQSGKGGGSCGA